MYRHTQEQTHTRTDTHKNMSVSTSTVDNMHRQTKGHINEYIDTTRTDKGDLKTNDTYLNPCHKFNKRKLVFSFSSSNFK